MNKKDAGRAWMPYPHWSVRSTMTYVLDIMNLCAAVVCESLALAGFTKL
jgi:hypothetical protein